MLTVELSELFDKQFAENKDLKLAEIVLKTKEILMTAWMDKLTEFVRIISLQYNKKLTVDEIECSMCSGEMVEVLITQLNHNAKVSKVSFDFFMSIAKKVPEIARLIEIASFMMNREPQLENSTSLNNTVSDTDKTLTEQ